MRWLLLCPALWLLSGCAAENPGSPRSSGIQSSGADRPFVPPDTTGKDSEPAGSEEKVAVPPGSAAGGQ